MIITPRVSWYRTLTAKSLAALMSASVLVLPMLCAAFAIIIYALHRATDPSAVTAANPSVTPVWIGSVDVGFFLWLVFASALVAAPSVPFLPAQYDRGQDTLTEKWSVPLALSLLGGAAVTLISGAAFVYLEHNLPVPLGLLLFAAPFPVIVLAMSKSLLRGAVWRFAFRATSSAVYFALLTCSLAQIALNNPAINSSYGLFIWVAIFETLCCGALALVEAARRQPRNVPGLTVAGVVGIMFANPRIFFGAAFALMHVR